MGQPAVVQGDRISGACASHQIPSPSGAPSPAGPLPFSAPLTSALTTTVLVQGRPAAVQGSNGRNQPAHVGLHASDPFAVAATQVGQVTLGSATVLLDGRPAAYSGCHVTMCAGAPGAVVGTAVTVLVGG